VLSLVVPVYLNQDSIPELLTVVEKFNIDLEGDFEAVFVVDGSPDRCYELLRDALPNRRFRSKLVLLSKNFGSFPAIRLGLKHAEGETFAVMAADLQEPPELIQKMNACLHSDEADVVVGVRDSRADPLMTRLPSQIFWALYRKFVAPEIPPGGVDVFGCNKAFRDTLLQLEEAHSSLIAQIFWLGFRRRTISYDRQVRKHGKSAWTLKKKINYLSDSIFAFTDLPIRWLIRFGGAGAVLAIFFGLVVIIARAFDFIVVPGYALTMFMITFLGAINLLGLGIVGSYAWRTYENTKKRPLAIVLKSHVF
jgi:glycosyltransferase involved in cell wall biosynthesis